MKEFGWTVLVLVMAASVVLADRPPRWTEDMKQILKVKGIKENLPPGYSRCCFKAVDPEGKNVTYAIAANDLFSVEATTGIFTLKKSLDREENSILSFIVTASDGVNTVSLESQVTVLDVNDHVPQVLGRKYAEVYENASIGDVIFDGLIITDDDTGPNALITTECAEIDALSNASCPIFGVESYQVNQGGLISYRVRLRLKQTVDYETLRGYIVTVRVSDQGDPVQSTLVNIIVDVKNVQDSRPIWLENPINSNVPDGSGVGQFVELVAARDRDGDPREVAISIIKDEFDMFNVEMFEIDDNHYTWMEVTLKKPVDRENKTTYSLYLRAEELLPDRSLSGVYTDAVVRVTIVDINDEKPTFDPAVLPPIEIQEELAERSEIPIMAVRDRDTAANGKMKIRLEQTYEAFEVNPPVATNVANLRLTVKNSKLLDYETPEYRQQVIKVIAEETELADKKNGPFTSTATVTIKLLDDNDNYPLFTETQYNQSVSEATAPGTSLLTVSAEDKDEGTNGEVTYRLEGAQSFFQNGVHINPKTGVLTLNKTLNFEKEQSISMFVIATDGGGLQTSVKLILRVLDVNDEAPVFTLSKYGTFVEENDQNRVLLPEITVRATDTEADATIRYGIVSGNTPDGAFAVDPVTGKFTLKRAIKFTETPGKSGVFKLNVSASDSGQPPMFGYTIVQVTVYDMNDNDPSFDDYNYFASVSEIAPPGTSVFEVTADDDDSGINGEIIYRITNGSLDHFIIDSNSGVIRVGGAGKLDYDVQKKYVITVLAEDKGSPPKSGSTYVTIVINDANNKMPYFPNKLILAKVPTNARAGHEIVQLNAIDRDTDHLLEYRMIPESFVAQTPEGTVYSSSLQTQMTVNSSSGLIYLIQSLDTDDVSEFRFQVVVQDNNAVQPPIQRATANVVCTVYKETGTEPEFNSPWTISNPTITLTMQEEEPPNTVVTTLIANDPINGEQLDGFTEVPGSDPDDYFRVAADSGQIILNKRVDFDTIQTPQVSVTVMVTSKDGARSATARVILNVQDINDNNPHFLRSEYTFEVSESKVFPSQVGVVQARDEDRGAKYGQITYSISGRGSEKFTIDPNSGFINVARGQTLDREQDAEYQLLAIASNEVQGEPNNKKSTSVRLTIEIEDENDVTPHFDEDKYTIYAVQTAEAQSSLGRVHASDEDLLSNGDVFYSIAGGDEYNLFYVNPNTGEIRSRTKLLNYARVRPYSLRVLGTDNGYPQRVGEVQVDIYIQDLQAYDGRPKFQAPFPGQIITIPEEEPAGLFVVKVVASDNDGPDELIRFSFLTGDEHADHQKFYINPVTGDINTTQVLDREVQESYNLLVLARDQDNPPQENTIVVLVKLEDKNDSIPSFYTCNTEATDPMYVTVMENEPVDTFVTRVISCDADVGENEVSYHHITCGNEAGYFKVEELTGVIRTTRTIDRELTPEFSLCVRVSNQRDALHETEDQPVKREVVGPKDTSLIHLIITVGDVDDNGPSYAHITNRQITVGIPIIGPFGSPVLDARVVDPDGLTNSLVKYQVTDLWFRHQNSVKRAPNMFSLGEFSGLIRTGLASYSDYAHGYFEMKIKAEDRQEKPRSDHLTVFIYILTQNQRLKFVFARKPDQVRPTLPAFSRELERISGVSMSTDNIRFSVGDDANFDYSRTDVCFHAVYNTELISYQEARNKLMNQNNPQLQQLFNEAGVERLGLCTFGMKSYTHWTTASFWWIIIVAALALILFTILCILFICHMWRRYKKYMDKQKPYVVAAPIMAYDQGPPPAEPSTLYVILGDEQPTTMPRSPNLRGGAARPTSLYSSIKDTGSPRPTNMHTFGKGSSSEAPADTPPSNPTTPI